MSTHSPMHSEGDPRIYDVTVADFDQRVLQRSHETPVLVDFWAEWCHPCLILAPVLERVINESDGRLLLAKLEVDDNMKLAGHYRVRGFPTVIVFQGGEEAGRFSGAQPHHKVVAFLQQHLPSSMS